jgi:hypothetical protein
MIIIDALAYGISKYSYLASWVIIVLVPSTTDLPSKN